MDETPMDLASAERYFRTVADQAREADAAGRWVSDTARAHQLVVDELDRLRHVVSATRAGRS